MSMVAGAGRCAVAAALTLLAHPAAAFYAEVKPAVTVGLDCVGQPNLLAPKLTVCAIAGARTRVWCPNGQLFEGASEGRDLAAALARSLCNMAQVP